MDCYFATIGYVKTVYILVRFLPGIRHKCYRNSLATSVITATMLTAHRLMRTWSKRVNAYIALTDFARAKFIEGGLPADKIHVKPNFVQHDTGVGSGAGEYALFVGRLSKEKGLALLIDAWRHIGAHLPLKIVGSGPLESLCTDAAASINGVQYLGPKSPDEVGRLMGDAKVLIVPSEWYEGFGLVIIEAFAKGTPVISSDIGSMAAINIHNYTGIHFPVGNIAGLVAAANWVVNNPATTCQWRLKRAPRV